MIFRYLKEFVLNRKFFCCFIFSFVFSIIPACSANEKQSKLVFQDRDLVGFQLSESEITNVLSQSDSIPILGDCHFLQVSDLRFLFHSIRDESPSLFGRSDRAVFPTGIDLTEFALNIYQPILESKISYKNNLSHKTNHTKVRKPFIFFLWKEDDSLNPYTRIRRTSFYLFCEENKLNIVFGEWKKDIVFQNHFTFSEWIASPRFNIYPSKKERFSILESSRNRLGFRSINKQSDTIVYPDWIVLQSEIELNENNKSTLKLLDDPQKHKIKNEQDNISDRLKTLDDLKKRGLISDKEFQDKRKEILDSL